MEDMRGVRNRRKKALVKWLVTFAVIAALLVLLIKLLPSVLSPVGKAPVVTYGPERTIRFYEPAWDVAVEDREDYAEYRELYPSVSIWFNRGSTGYEYVGTNAASFTDAEQFVIKYIECIMSGDVEGYNALFADGANGRKDRFTAQLLYDVRVNVVSDVEYDVYYKIFHNDGTFRDDLSEGGSKGMRISLTYSNREYQISDVRFISTSDN